MQARNHGRGSGASHSNVSRDDGETTRRDAATRVSYWTLLKQPQITVLCFSRMGESMFTTSLYSYLFFQLRYLSPTASEATIATQAGIVVGSATFAKVCTGVLWGMLADAKGRKPVMLLGLLSSSIACIDYGFSTSFEMAIFWQMLQGSMNSQVAMARTVVAEIFADSDPKVRSRALLLLVLISSIGMLLGPLIGGFANNRSGLGTLSSHPYALPNLIIGAWYAAAALGVLFIVRETLERSGKSRPPAPVTSLWDGIRRAFRPYSDQKPTYRPVPEDEQSSVPLTSTAPSTADPTHGEDEEAVPTASPPPKPSFRQLWTPQVICTMTAHFIIIGQISSFSTLLTVFSSMPVSVPSSDSQDPAQPFLFGGGIGMSPRQIGAFMACAMVIGVLLQILLLPRLNERMGTVTVWRYALCVFPLTYFLAPFPALVASKFSSPSTSSSANDAGSVSIATWAAITAVMILFMIARSGTQPPVVILINESVPHPSSRATINTLGTSVGNLARSTFPVTVMAIYGLGVRNGFVAAAFWLLSLLALVTIAVSRLVARGVDEKAVLKKPKAESGVVRDEGAM